MSVKPGRSPESIARRLAYTRAWQASQKGKAYHKTWRAEHPATERVRRRRWKDANPERVRASESRRRERRRESERVGPLHVGHPLFDAARTIVGRDPNAALVTFYDPLYEDTLSEAVVALLEGRDAESAVRTYRAAEGAYRRTTCPILAELVA